MIEIKNLYKKYDDITVVDNLSLNVGKGEVLGFLGPNGAGKSTTMKMVTGFIEPSSGAIKIKNLLVQESAYEIKKHMGYLPEGAPQYGEMTTLDFLLFIAKIRGIEKNKINESIESAIENLSLKDVLAKRIEHLSKGFKRRVGIAQAIIHDPEILIMDEPTDGLDPNQKHEVRTLIKNMSEDRTILISTHILEEVDAVCTRAMIISEGRVVGYGTPDELMSQSLYRNSVTVSVNAEDHIPLMNDFNKLDFVYSVEHLPEKRQGLVTMRLFPQNKESITRQLEHYLFSKKIPIEQFVVGRGRMQEVFRDLTTNC